MKKKIIIGALFFIATLLFLGSGFFFGYKVGRQIPETIIVQGINSPEQEKPSSVDFGTFWQAWKMIDDVHLNSQNTNTKTRMYGAIKGLVGSLGDPYSEFFPPDDNEKFREDIQGSFGGIGAELGMRDGQLVIISPLKGTPAMMAGLQPEDKILAINSSSTADISVIAAVKWIRGPVGEPVTLTIMRDDWEKTRDIKIIRDIITIPTLEAEIIGGEIAHIQLLSFNSNANDLFYDEMLRALTGGAKGLILDLRNNPGGFLEVAVDLAGWFVPRGSLVVSQEGRGDNKIEFRASGNAALKDFPMTILINKGSASASEILAGAIKVHRDNVRLVGEKTFGKGTVQELNSLRDGSAVKLTISHWVLPNGKIIEGEGIEPDVAVEITEKDIEEKRDAQLEKAMEILKQEISK